MKYFSMNVMIQKRTTQIIRTAIISVFFFLVSTFPVIADNANSQGADIVFKQKNISLEAVIQKIEVSTNDSFFYSAEQIDMQQYVIASVKKTLVIEIPNDLSRFNNFNIKVIDRNLIVLSPNTLAPKFKVTGTIISDKSSETLIGVTIKEKGTSVTTVTDVKGTFTIQVSSPNAILEVSYMGYDKQEFAVNNLNHITIKLVESITTLDEFVVVGYGKQKKSDVTGAVSSVSGDRIKNAVTTDLSQVLQGALSGVSISSSAGGANGITNILIRGRNSISADTSPLIILDGIPYDGQLNDIAPNTVQSIEVLKDASSKAIYGSRGSNGVIIVTSKQGQSGKMKIAYDANYSIQRIAHLPRLMDGAEYYKYKNDRYASPGGNTDENFIYPSEQDIFNQKAWVNWADLVFRNGQSQNHDLSISGGNENTRYFISGGYLKVAGIAVNNNYSRITNRINLETKFTKWLTFGSRTQLLYNDQGGLPANFNKVYSQDPLNIAFNPDGSITKTPYLENINSTSPLEPLLATNYQKSYQVFTNNYLNISFPFIKGLLYQLNTGLRYSYDDQFTYFGLNTVVGTKVGGDGSTNKNLSSSQLLENILSYNLDFGKHTLFVTGLYSFEGKHSNGEQISASGFSSDILGIYGMSQAKLIMPTLGYSHQNLISQMLRVNYSYASRYLVTLTARRDGFSGFGAQTKFGVFPSVALGWNIANEGFFKKSSIKDVINTLKLRMSYGENGNQAVGPYETISRLGSSDYVYGSSSAPGYIPVKLGLDNLGWERARSTNIGFDYGILKNRINGDINIYSTNTFDLLLKRTISAVQGITTITQNIGKINNTGLEFSVNSINIQAKNFTWSTTANFAFIKNKIVDLYGNGVNDVANKLFIGSPITSNYDYVFTGVWQIKDSAMAKKYNSLPGYIKIKDVNGDTLINSYDRQIIGQRDPKFTWGFANTLTYKSFTLYVFIIGVEGVTKLNDIETDGNMVYHNWWTPANPTNEYWANMKNANITSVPVYQNASFIRVKDASLSYNFSPNLLKHIGIESARLIVSGKNLFTLTKWTGVDPEINTQQGIPLQKEYVLGLSIGF